MPNSTIRTELVRHAQSGALVSYSDIAALMHMDLSLVTERNELWGMLGEISQYEVAQGRPMLSAIVVMKGTEQPGFGFFELAKKLKVMKETDKKRRFFETERDRVFAYWSNAESGEGVG